MRLSRGGALLATCQAFTDVAALVTLVSLLDKKQRRLYAGLEALRLGHGGDRRIAGLLGLDPATVARGRRELGRGDVGASG